MVHEGEYEIAFSERFPVHFGAKLKRLIESANFWGARVVEGSHGSRLVDLDIYMKHWILEGVLVTICTTAKCLFLWHCFGMKEVKFSAILQARKAKCRYRSWPSLLERWT